ncbi:MAG: hypothetical protein EOP83_02420 [Verrucomicrobiaceae bacterium]|nr:MAG: hypothetical protein EOP83_02420 [Verrucomicrobiaceae bacterium]
MGKLIALDDFFQGSGGTRRRDDPSLRDSFWYFSDTSRRSRTTFEPEKTYPYSVFIHQAWLEGKQYFYNGDYGHSPDNAGRFRVALREWIEANIEGTVIYRTINKHYHLVLAPPAVGEQKRTVLDVEHSYYEFMFQDEAAIFHIKLRYPEYVRMTPEKYHPNYIPEPGQDYAETQYEARRIVGEWY